MIYEQNTEANDSIKTDEQIYNNKNRLRRLQAIALNYKQ